MGSGRDKRKKAKEKVEGPQAGKGSLKTERKTQKNEVRVQILRHGSASVPCVLL